MIEERCNKVLFMKHVQELTNVRLLKWNRSKFFYTFQETYSKQNSRTTHRKNREKN